MPEPKKEETLVEWHVALGDETHVFFDEDRARKWSREASKAAGFNEAVTPRKVVLHVR